MKIKMLLVAIAVSASAHAQLVQPAAIIDDATVRVRAGEQRNGTLAFEALISRTTIQAHDSFMASVSRSGFAGVAGRSIPTAAVNFSSSLPSSPAVPDIEPPVTPPVPEPETYALLGLGLIGLYLRKKKV